MNLNLRLLRVFEEVCARGGVTRAAEALHMAQPAVTDAIRRLERDAGLALFDRLSRRLHLTESGKAYREKARRILELCADLEENPAGMESRIPLRIGCCITIACFRLPAILGRFERGGAGRAEVRVASAGAVMEMLAANRIDLALYEGPEPREPWIAMPFSSYRLQPVCHPGHRFAGKRNVPLNEFMGEKLLLRERGSAIRDVFDSFLRLRQLTVRPMITSVNSQALIQAVKADLGVSVLPDALAAGEARQGGIARFSIEGMRLENTNWIVFHADKRQSRSMSRFIECARSGKRPSPPR